MRGNMFCASQASTAICMSNMDQPSSSSSSSTYNPGSTPFIDRHNPIISRDARRIIPPKPPCSFQTPISPKPQNPQNKNQNNSAKQKDYLVRSKKSKKQTDQKNKQSFVKENDNSNITVKKNAVVKASSNLITPPGSTRYLLGESGFFNMYSDFDPVAEPKKNQIVKAVEPVEHKNQILKTDESSSSLDSHSSKPSSSSPSPDQVVVLRVSLHCKGCEAKVKKHISRMAGVTTFDIDFAAKKVTVVGDVTPLSVLASISKVKNAQLLDPSSVPRNYFATNPSYIAANK